MTRPPLTHKHTHARALTFQRAALAGPILSLFLVPFAVSVPQPILVHAGLPLTAELFIPAGCDLFEVSGTLDLDLPPGFFHPTSGPIQETLTLSGVPLGTAGPFELGTTSLVFERLAPTTIDPLPSMSMRCEFEVQQARLNATQALVVPSGATTQSWRVSLHILGGSQSDGHYDILRLQPGAGTLSGGLKVPLLVVLNGPSGEILRHPLGTTTLDLANSNWVEFDASQSAGLDVSQLPHGVAFATTLASADVTLTLTPAAVDPNRPGPRYVDPNASISPQVDSLGRGCSIEENASIGANAVVGPGSTIADGAQVGVGVVIGARASIGSGSALQADSYVGSGAVIGDGVTIGAGAVIGDGAVVYSGTVIEAGVVVGADSVIGGSTTVSAGARLGSDVYVGRQVLIDAGLSIPAGCRVAGGSHQVESIVRCIRDDGTTEFRVLPMSSWSTSLPPVAIQDDDGIQPGQSQPTPPLGFVAPPALPPHLDVVDPTNPPGGIGSLPADIGNTIAPPSGGGTGHPYCNDYQCGWFAEQLRRRLAARHYPMCQRSCHPSESHGGKGTRVSAKR